MLYAVFSVGTSKYYATAELLIFEKRLFNFKKRLTIAIHKCCLLNFYTYQYETINIWEKLLMA